MVLAVCLIVLRVDFQAAIVWRFIISQALFVLFVFNTMGLFVLAYGEFGSGYGRKL
jgi:hypothetical protein